MMIGRENMFRKFVALLMVLCLLITGLSFAEVTLCAAVPGVTEEESALSLFDGNLETKWCVLLSGQEAFSVRFSVDAEMSPASFILATANDNETYTGRSPEFITLYGSAAEELPEESDTSWQVVLERTPLSLPERNMTPWRYDLPAGAGTFRHFWLKLEKQSGDCMQISEFALLGANHSVEYPVPVLAMELKDGTLTATDAVWTGEDSSSADWPGYEAGEVPLCVVLKQYAVTTAKLNFRKAPNGKAEKLSVLPKDEHVYVLYAEPNEDGELWAIVEVDGKIGFVKTDYLYLLTKKESSVLESEHPAESRSWTEDDIFKKWLSLRDEAEAEAKEKAEKATPSPAPTPTKAPKKTEDDVPSVLKALSGEVVRGQFATQKATKNVSEYNVYSYDNWSDPSIDELPYLLILASGDYPFKLVGTKTDEMPTVGAYYTYYGYRYTGSKDVTPLRDSNLEELGTIHMIVVASRQYERNKFTISVRLTPGLTYGGRNEMGYHGDVDPDPVPNPDPVPTGKKPRSKCPKCSGGKVTCRQCGGTGGKWIYDNSTRSTGKTWENCFSCKGNGKVDCTYCGGDGWIND